MLHRSTIGASLYRPAVKIYKFQEGEYRDYLVHDDVKSASAVTDERVSDTNTVQAMG